MEGEEDQTGKDLYAMLELERTASQEEIRGAFRRIAAKNHPDRNADDTKAGLRFKRANAAYQVLSDPEKKRLYDELTTPIEDLPKPEPQALVRTQAAAGFIVCSSCGASMPKERMTCDCGAILGAWRAGERRRRRKRVRRTDVKGWGIALAAVLVVAAAWLVVPDPGHDTGTAITPSSSQVASPLGRARDVGTVNPVVAAAEADRVSRALDDYPTPGANPRARASAQPPPVPETDSPGKTVTGDRWVFVVPEDWKDASDAKRTLWKGPVLSTGDQPTVSLVVSSFNGDAASYFKALERRSRRNVVVDREESWESESEPDGLKREGRVVVGGTAVSRFVEYTVATRGHGYELTCGAPLVAFEAVEPTCEQILGSLQIK